MVKKVKSCIAYLWLDYYSYTNIITYNMLKYVNFNTVANYW